MSQDTKNDICPLLWQDLAEITKSRVMDALRERLDKGQPGLGLELLDLLGMLGFEFSHKIIGSIGMVYTTERQVWLRPRVDGDTFVRGVGYV